MSLFFKKNAPTKNKKKIIVKRNSILKKSGICVLYKKSPSKPQSKTSYALKKNKNAIATITVIHHGKNSKLPNIKTLKIILRYNILKSITS